MNILSYSPSVEVYAAVGSSEGTRYLDLTSDVLQVNVNRKCDAASTFSVKLQNVGNKYNDVFLPMDRIKVFATKVDRHPLITGYVTKVPKFTIYGADITLEGSCALYRMQELYWDPNLWESAALLGYGGNEDNWSSVVMNLLTKVAGYSEGQIMMGQMPNDVVDWAKKMYVAGAKQTEQLKNMVDEFHNILQTHGPQLAGTASQTAGGGFSLLGDGVNFDVTEEKFVKEWGPRIDAFIARVQGTHAPLYGHGNAFASGAWKGRMDPRWLPAVSFLESNCGLAVPSYAPYNCYGWGITDSGVTGVAYGDGYDQFIHFILDNAGGRGNGWGGEKVLNEYTDLAELDETYCSSSAERINTLKELMGSI